MKCDICPLECDLSVGEFGKCNVRMAFREGVGLANYGQVTTAIAGPIEQKPFFHLNPGMRVLSIGGSGCNMSCGYCQNFEISQSNPKGKVMLPSEVVRMALDKGCQGVAFTYAEPIVMYEYVMDVARVARDAGLLTLMKTNGYANPRWFENLCRVMDGVNVDFKGSERAYRESCGVEFKLGPWIDNLEMATKHCHLEMAFPAIPGDKGWPSALLAVIERLGHGIPFHVLKFVPDFKMRWHEPATAEFVREVALDVRTLGFSHVYETYPGFVNETKCSFCARPIMRRVGAATEDMTLNGHCSHCGLMGPIRIIPACATTTSAATPTAASSSR